MLLTITKAICSLFFGNELNIMSLVCFDNFSKNDLFILLKSTRKAV